MRSTLREIHVSLTSTLILLRLPPDKCFEMFMSRINISQSAACMDRMIVLLYYDYDIKIWIHPSLILRFMPITISPRAEHEH